MVEVEVWLEEVEFATNSRKRGCLLVSASLKSPPLPQQQPISVCMSLNLSCLVASYVADVADVAVADVAVFRYTVMTWL